MPIDVLPEVRDTAGALGTLRHESWPVELPLCGQVVDQQAALAGAGCVVPGRVKATYGTGVFVLGHVGDQVPEPSGGLLPTVAWRIDGRMEYAIDGGVFAAGAMLEWMCRELGMAENPAALTELARAADDNGGARVLPGLAGARRALVEARGARGDRRHARRDDARERGARGARGHRLARGRRGGRDARDDRRSSSLRVDGGLTNEPLLLQLQADTIGVRVDAAGADATVLGAAVLAAVGSGVIASLPGGGRAAADRPLGRAAAGRRLAHARARTLEGVRARARLSCPGLGRARRAAAAAAAARPARRLLMPMPSSNSIVRIGPL